MPAEVTPTVTRQVDLGSFKALRSLAVTTTTKFPIGGFRRAFATRKNLVVFGRLVTGSALELDMVGHGLHSGDFRMTS